MDRRIFLGAMGGLMPAFAYGELRIPREPGSRVKLGLNAYSFDKPLRDGSMKLEDAVHFCAQNGIEGLDATGYYFPGYPKVPSDEYIHNLKRIAFVNGVTISGTGVRNDFAVADAASRRKDVQMVKEWIEVASKLGAPVIRVFSGKQRPEGHSFDEAFEWMVGDFKECVAHGKRHGVIVALQQHDDFLKTADETIRTVDAVNSEWFGVILDVGSLRQGDPYKEIEKLLPYAVSWQIKETVWYGTKATPIDLKRIKSIIDKSNYRGFVPFEALGASDPRETVRKFLGQVRREFAL